MNIFFGFIFSCIGLFIVTIIVSIWLHNVIAGAVEDGIRKARTPKPLA